MKEPHATPARGDEPASSRQDPTPADRGDLAEWLIDETLRESFPASDPPGWVLGKDPEDAAAPGGGRRK